ncbi:MAG: NUDIX hydrolase [Phycisphaerales bacterium]
MPDTPPHSSPTITCARTLVHAKKFNYEELTIAHPSGHVETRHLIRHPGACLILPIMPDGRLMLIRVWRASFGRALLEFPAGTLEPGESPETTAARELEEEAGCRADTIERLATFYTSPGLSDEVMQVFVARGLLSVGQKLEPYEQIEVQPYTTAQVEQAIDQGDLLDGKSILAWMLAIRRGVVRVR